MLQNICMGTTFEIMSNFNGRVPHTRSNQDKKESKSNFLFINRAASVYASLPQLLRFYYFLLSQFFKNYSNNKSK